ncbi:MAG: hypothetical protein K8R25_12475 [Methanosarcinales archaeon]|jgi:SHS2 domain-containing protein|nr:hypothetical protein [Methanosarcinales archaeon]
MPKRKVIIEVEIRDDRINSIEDLEQEILTQDIYGQIAKKYLDSLQDDMAQHVNARKGSKNVHIKTHHFEFDFQAKRTLNEMGKKHS